MRAILCVSIVLSILSLEGCATTAGYQAKVRSWEGQDAGSLVQAWGQPDDKQPVHGGNTMYVYARLKRMPVAYSDYQHNYYANARNPAELFGHLHQMLDLLRNQSGQQSHRHRISRRGVQVQRLKLQASAPPKVPHGRRARSRAGLPEVPLSSRPDPENKHDPI